MKKIAIVVLLMTSFAALAQDVYVRFNSREVSLSVWNRSGWELRCSGPLSIFTMDGRVHTFNNFFPVRPQGTMTRWIRPNLSAPIRTVNHSIWCR